MDGFSPADEAASFEQAIQAKAAKAENELMRLRSRFTSLSDVTRYCQTLRRELSSLKGRSDQAHLGTAWGLVGDMERCPNALDRGLVVREEAYSGICGANAWMLDARQAAAREGTFRAWVLSTVNATRAALKLPEPVALPGRRDYLGAACPGCARLDG